MYNFRYHRFNDKYINLLAYNVSGNWLVLGFHMYTHVHVCVTEAREIIQFADNTIKISFFSHQMQLSAELQRI